jgi:hypothetical protein
MRKLNTGFAGNSDFGSNFTMCMGVVKDNADPAQCGRLKVYIPAVDSKDFESEDLPWATYCSPFGGTTQNAIVGRDSTELTGGSAYGFWAIPKVGGQVLIGFLEGEPNIRFWMGCFYMPELNRTMPQSINNPPLSTEIDESGLVPQTEMAHYAKNLQEGGLGPTSKHWKTRGGFERSISYPENKTKNKPVSDGYFTKPHEPEKSDSQTIALTSPGRHFISMQDIDEFCRMRMKTTEGTQIILDDTNERIYISTARGRNWVEIDEGSGKIYFYTSSKFNIHSENDLNLYSSENINIVAKKRVNIQSEDRAVKIQAKSNVEVLSTDANIKISASRDMHLKTFNGPKASAVTERIWCSPPPYAGDPLGLRRDWAEEAGASTSKIFINSVDGAEIRVDNGDLKLTSKNNLEIRSIGSSIDLQAPSVVGITTAHFATTVGSYGFVAIDGEEGQIPIETLGDHGGAAAADSGAKVTFETVKPKMVVPKHETTNWVRDEDEASCPTPRNPKYQG